MARVRAWIATVAAALGAALTVLTAFVPDWIEAFLGVAPDGGDGSAELYLLGALVVLAIVSALWAAASWRGLRRAATAR
jgi:hypothetical protein